jgi:hypothetical protein
VSAEAALEARLVDYAGLAALVATRIYPNTLPQAGTLPAVVYQRLPGQRVRAMHADTGLVRARFWLHVYAATYASAKAVATQVIGALNRWSGTSATVVVQNMETDDGQDSYDPDSRQHHVSINLNMDYQE